MRIIVNLINTSRMLVCEVFFFSLAISMLISCGSNERHTLQLVYPQNLSYYESSKLLYPGQTLDSVVFCTTESFRIETNENWISVLDPSDEKKELENVFGNLYYVQVKLKIAGNDTGKMRVGLVSVYNTYYDQPIVAEYFQTAWHNISRPEPIVTEMGTYVQTKLPLTMGFTLVDSAYVDKDNVEFKAYDRWQATLEDASVTWLHVLTPEGNKFESKLELSFDANDTGSDRSAVVLLSSNNVVTRVLVKQLKKYDGLPNSHLMSVDAMAEYVNKKS